MKPLLTKSRHVILILLIVVLAMLISTLAWPEQRTDITLGTAALSKFQCHISANVMFCGEAP